MAEQQPIAYAHPEVGNPAGINITPEASTTANDRSVTNAICFLQSCDASRCSRLLYQVRLPVFCIACALSLNLKVTAAAQGY